jgi:hypothetical protein
VLKARRPAVSIGGQTVVPDRAYQVGSKSCVMLQTYRPASGTGRLLAAVRSETALTWALTGIVPLEGSRPFPDRAVLSQARAGLCLHGKHPTGTRARRISNHDVEPGR